MVQILPTAGSAFGQGISQGLSESLPGMVSRFHDKRKRESEYQKANQAISSLDPNATLAEKMSKIASLPISDESKKFISEGIRQQGIQSYLGKVKENGGLDEQLALEGLVSGFIPPGAGQDIIRNITGAKEKETGLKLYGDQFKDAQKLAQDSRQKLAGIRSQREILERNPEQFGPLSWDNLLSKLGIPGASSAEAQAFQAATLGYIGGERQRFGGVLSDADVRLISTKLPDIARTKAGNEAILDLRESEASFADLQARAMQNVATKNKGLTLDFGTQVNEELNQLLAQNPDVQRKYQLASNTLLEEAKVAPTQKKSTSSQSRKDFNLQSLPSASDHKGKVVEDDKGNRYKSDGKKWSKI